MPSEVRILAGRLKHRAIRIPSGTGTRPALVLVRKVIGDTLAPFIAGASVLDLFAGTGAFMFEMLSRGAQHGVAVELDRRMAGAILENSRALGLESQVDLLNLPFETGLSRLADRQARFEIIFVAPPFYGDYVTRSLQLLKDLGLLAAGGVIVAHYHKKDRVQREYSTFSLWKTKTHGNSVMDFYRASTS